MKSLLLSLAIFLAAASSGAAPKPGKTPEEILRQVDEMYRAKSSYSEMLMRIETPSWTREMEMKGWGRGMDETLVKILSPAKDRGVGTLRVKSEMWNYFPKINKVIKVAPSMMMGSWMGSDFTNDDLVRESTLTKDYSMTLQETSDLYRFTLTPKATTATVWGKIEVVVQKADLLPVEYVYWDEKGEKIRVMTFEDIRQFGKTKVPARMVMTPLKKPGHRTIIQYKALQLDLDLDTGVFTQRNLTRPL